MIVREREDSFVMIEQHHHADIAGQLYDHLKDSLKPTDAWRDAISTAIFYHDCGWIPFDKEPFWDDENAVPYSFSDMPIGPKVVLYRFSIDQVEEKSAYAALLCSIHFVSFLKNRRDDLSQQFVESEQFRQEQIKNTLYITDDVIIQKYYELLKFFDDFSLYMCLNEPGTKKNSGHFFFKEGLHIPSSFNKGILQLDWEQHEKITMNHDLFKDDVTIYLQQKVILKNTIEEIGVKKAYREAVVEVIPITIVANDS